MSLKNAKWARSLWQAHYQQWRSLLQAAPNEAPTLGELEHRRWRWGFTGICWEQHYGKIGKFCISFPGLIGVWHICLFLAMSSPDAFLPFFPPGAPHASPQQRPPQSFSSFPSSPQVSPNLFFLFHPVIVRVTETSQPACKHPDCPQSGARDQVHVQQADIQSENLSPTSW